MDIANVRKNRNESDFSLAMQADPEHSQKDKLLDPTL